MPQRLTHHLAQITGVTSEVIPDESESESETETETETDDDKIDNNYFTEESSAVFKLITANIVRDPTYAMGLLEPATKRVLLTKYRACRNSEENSQKRLQFAKNVVFYSENTLEDLFTLAEELFNNRNYIYSLLISNEITNKLIYSEQYIELRKKINDKIIEAIKKSENK